MTSATDELRRMLDELGVDWDELVGHPVVVGTEWHDRDGCPCTALEHADDVPDGILSVQANLTPEQAIAATLGTGTCKVESMHGYTDAHTHTSWCVELSCHTLDAWEDTEPPNYCPICGARVVE